MGTSGGFSQNLRVIMLCVLGVVGCGPSSGTRAVVKECILPDDQTGTLSARWESAPIPVAVKAGQFDSSEVAEIAKAAQIWNSFSESSLNFRFLDTAESAGTIREVSSGKPAAVCSQGILTGGQFSGNVVIFKQGKWPYNNHDAIALTSFCPSPAKPVPSIYTAIMEVNYQDFFIEGKKLPDLTSIFVHEFGHLLGLDHSCDTRGRAGFPDCNDSTASSDYLKAVMFPVILFDTAGFGEVRRDLNKNDMGRANCLYQDLSLKTSN